MDLFSLSGFIGRSSRFLIGLDHYLQNIDNRIPPEAFPFPDTHKEEANEYCYSASQERGLLDIQPYKCGHVQIKVDDCLTTVFSLAAKHIWTDFVVIL